MPQRRQPATGQNPLPVPRQAGAPEELGAEIPVSPAPETGALDPSQRRTRQLPDFRTRDNIEQ